MSEEILQRAVARVLDASGLLWCHVPNGGMRNAIVAAKLRGQGVKPGVPDCLVFAPFVEGGKTRYGLAIELKNGKAGRTSEHQETWLVRLELAGWKAVTCRDLDSVLNILQKCYPSKFPIHHTNKA